jgi:hypothetical protein
MTLFARTGLVALALAGLAAVQEKKAIEIYAENNDEGVSIRAFKSPGKDQMWEALKATSGFFKDSAVVVRHRVDLFTVEVNVTRKDPKEPMSTWAKTADIAKGNRENFTKKEGDKEPNWKECKVVSEDPKAKLAIGSGHMHRLLLTDQQGGTHEIIEYFILSSDVLYRITVHFNKESYDKYFAKEGMVILNSINRAKVVKKK